jgi:predicted nucleotidyltransferase
VKGSSVVGALRRERNFLKEKFGVKELLLFGSFARGEETLNSDVDLVVEFFPEYETFRNYMALKSYLEELLGRPVDLLVKGGIKEHFLAEIEKEALNV